jgi:hypothetical protein
VPIAVNEMSASNLSQWSIFYHAIQYWLYHISPEWLWLNYIPITWQILMMYWYHLLNNFEPQHVYWVILVVETGNGVCNSMIVVYLILCSISECHTTCGLLMSNLGIDMNRNRLDDHRIIILSYCPEQFWISPFGINILSLL